MDRRKFINYNTLKTLHSCFLKPMQDRDLDVHILTGNHDLFFRNTTSPNCLDELRLQFAYDKYHTYTKPETNSDGICIIPWICAETEDAALETIKSTDAAICFGHFHLQGFEMHRGTFSESGFDPKLLDKFSLVCSGHFHTKSTYNQINYLGSATEQTWADYMDPKGFHILDTETMELEFVQNPYKMFHKLAYDDRDTTLEQLIDKDFSYIEDAFVKVIVKEKLNPYWFDMFAAKLDEAGPHRLQFVEDHLSLYVAPDAAAATVEDSQDTLSILRKYRQEVEKDLSSPKAREALAEVLEELYKEAQYL